MRDPKHKTWAKMPNMVSHQFEGCLKFTPILQCSKMAS